MLAEPGSARVDEDLVLVVAASPFEGGVLLGALPAAGRTGPCVLKGRSGLVTGIGLPEVLFLNRSATHERDWPWSSVDAGAMPDDASLFYSKERSLESGDPHWGDSPSEHRFMGEPVRLFKGSRGQVRRVYRASLESAPRVPEDLTREAELKLQWELDQGSSLEVRMRGLVMVLGWLAQKLEEGQTDCEIGIHEPELHYSVDRVSWREL